MSMGIASWEKRYREQHNSGDSVASQPAPLVVKIANPLPPGRALDLACGTGRNALYLAEHGWSVTAIDGAPTGIAILREYAAERGLNMITEIGDLEKGECRIGPESWDLILMCCYLQRDLFEPTKNGLVPGGILLAVVLLAELNSTASPFALQPGELAAYFQDWEILHSFEGKKQITDERAVAEIVARRPMTL
jgi:tellurite methyltransferase